MGLWYCNSKSKSSTDDEDLSKTIEYIGNLLNDILNND